MKRYSFKYLVPFRIIISSASLIVVHFHWPVEREAVRKLLIIAHVVAKEQNMITII